MCGEHAVSDERFDVIVVGTGLAGTAAALAANEQGAHVLVLEKAPRSEAGGSTRLSGGGFRVPSESYPPDAFFDDLMLVTRNRGNPALLRQLADRAAADVAWLQTYGLTWGDAREFRPDLAARRVQIQMARPKPFRQHGIWQIGSGNGVVAQLHPALFERVTVKCGVRAESCSVDQRRRVTGVCTFSPADGYVEFRAPAVILACGGFQANSEMRSRYFARPAADWVVRGTPHNTGDGQRMGMALGAAAVGEWADYHCAVVDARSVGVACGETNINTYPFTVIVNERGERFLDEGEDYRDRTYAKFGRLILEQPGSHAFCVFDAQVADIVKGLIAEWEPTSAESLNELAAVVGIDADGLADTIAEFNASVSDGVFDPNRLDGKATIGLRPAKSNWANTIQRPPFFALRVTGGLTFTFGGLRADVGARVLDSEGVAIDGLYAAGEIVGDFFYHNYPSGSSLVRSAVYGRIAGTNAAITAAAAAAVPAELPTATSGMSE